MRPHETAGAWLASFGPGSDKSAGRAHKKPGCAADLPWHMAQGIRGTQSVPETTIAAHSFSKCSAPGVPGTDRDCAAALMEGSSSPQQKKCRLCGCYKPSCDFRTRSDSRTLRSECAECQNKDNSGRNKRARAAKVRGFCAPRRFEGNQVERHQTPGLRPCLVSRRVLLSILRRVQRPAALVPGGYAGLLVTG